MEKLEDFEEIDLGFESSTISLLDHRDDHDHDHETTTLNLTLSRRSFAYYRTSSEASTFSEQLTNDDLNSCSSDAQSPVCWPGSVRSPYRPALSRFGGMKPNKFDVEDRLETLEPMDLELEMMKERFSKLLLGEDMSGSGKGVSTAVTVSNAITNIYASMFCQQQKLEPLHPERKIMWKREMNCLLSVCDYIEEFIPTSHSLHNTKPMEAHRKDKKWWFPVPCLPSKGFSEKARKHLKLKRDSANGIHKETMAINSSILAEMEIPHTYITSLPKVNIFCIQIGRFG
ncbi:Rop guanine nucleotide exchange factor 3-like protein [Tanacetum coccineum]|uniref:Rop guanine nucleotide exchange factor 3-like protein n=1 Tax=Tanacetum coccineum TaxID=301880 RepID=A0ABQ5HRX9_9ASTR